IAITDHDTLDGVPAAQDAARGTGLEVIPAVEISCEHQNREIHLLGYFVRLDDPSLKAALRRLRQHRVDRFREMIERLRLCGVSVDGEDLPDEARSATLGRRHLAELLVRCKKVGSVREAFLRYLGDRGRAVAPKVRLPVAEAIACVRGAGGVASWAHPAY